MPQRLIQIITDSINRETLDAAIEKHETTAHWSTTAGRKRISYNILARSENIQALADDLQRSFTRDKDSHIVVLPVEALLAQTQQKEEPSKPARTSGILREELYEDIAKGATLDTHFILITVLSTIVAAIGLLEDNVAVLVGAMVIAPFLGPNLALALSTTLGDIQLMKSSLRTNITGASICFFLSVAIGIVWHVDAIGPELTQRTYVGLSGVVLALASGAAGVLSLTRGTSSILVGVMVAVALLPPVTTSGIMLGSGYYSEALGAAMLLAVNIVCVNLSAKLTFLYKGVRPRTWYRQKKAGDAMRWYIVFWIISLLVLVAVMYLRDMRA